MSLTLSPLFARSSQLNTKQTSEDVDNFCGIWITKHKPLLAGLGVAPGTTFPPFSQNLPYLNQRLPYSLVPDKPQAKWKSEPDLNSEYNPDSLEDNSNEYHDEDYLFEFDIDSPASSEDQDSIESEDKPMVNVIEGEGEDLKGRFSVSSSSSSTCSHRKESGVVVDGFSSIFGSGDSSPTDRRSILRQFEDSRGMSVNPEEWREKGALYLGVSLSPSDLGGTPILEVAAKPECPYVSPDSVIEEDSLLSEQDLCIPCATELSLSRTGETAEESRADVSEDRPDTRSGNGKTLQESSQSGDEKKIETENVSQFNTDDIMLRLSQKVNSCPDVRIEIHPELSVSKEKLTNLLDKLGPIKEDSDSNNEEDENVSPNRLHHKNSLDVRPRLRKCSSLRSTTTPTKTSSERKIVRFADILGLDLSETKVFMDDIPRVPKAAYADLDVNLSDIDVGSPVTKLFQPQPIQTIPKTADFSLVPMFNQPGGSPNFLERVSRQKVCLENAFMEGPSTVQGIVRVQNISFQKAVVVRWTVNNWQTVSESTAQYILGSSHGDTDKFSFRLSSPNLKTGERLQFCLRYECLGDHWDSNDGTNYTFQVVANSNKLSQGGIPQSRSHSRSFRLSASQSPSQHGDDPWLRFM